MKIKNAVIIIWSFPDTCIFGDCHVIYETIHIGYLESTYLFITYIIVRAQILRIMLENDTYP